MGKTREEGKGSRGEDRYLGVSEGKDEAICGGKGNVGQKIQNIRKECTGEVRSWA